MPGRHEAVAPRRPSGRRPRVRWLVGLAGGAALAATLVVLNSNSAGAAGDPVGATFGVTGVATSNCKVSVGGTDVYVKPGQELDVKTSIIGLTLLGVPLDLGKLASLDGALVIDPKSDHPTRLDITNKVQKLTDLTAGDHTWKWTVSTVKVGLLRVPLGLSSKLLKVGAKLSWDGTIHVTSDAADCGIAVQLPGVSASASVTGLPPIGIGIPGIKVSLPVTVPDLPTPTLPGNGGGGGHTGNGGGHTGHSAPPPVTNNPIPVPARVVPGDDGSGLLGGGIDFGGIPAGPVGGVADPLTGVAADPSGAPATAVAAQQPRPADTGKKPIELAASRPASTGEVWVVLAIIAVIALAFVAATYARLYLLKRGS